MRQHSEHGSNSGEAMRPAIRPVARYRLAHSASNSALDRGKRLPKYTLSDNERKFDANGHGEMVQCSEGLRLHSTG